MSLLNPRTPLYLPNGSVRSLIALLIVVPVAVLALTSGIELTGDQYVGLVTLIVGAYFVQKAGEKRS